MPDFEYEDENDENIVKLIHNQLDQSQAFISVKKDKPKNAYSVERNFVNSIHFHNHFSLLPVNKSVQEALYREAGTLLEKMDGKDEERLIAINARNGFVIIDNYEREGEKYRTGFSDEEYKKIIECKDYIILMHNHPDSSPPSGQDLISYFKEDKVKLSIIVCHDGDLYAITRVDKITVKLYHAFLEEYSSKLDEDSAKTLATDALYKLNEDKNFFEVRRCHYE